HRRRHRLPLHVYRHVHYPAGRSELRTPRDPARDARRDVSVPGVTSRRRVLLVSHVFPPLVAGGAPRMGQFARLLPKFGWDVTVRTGRHGDGASIDRAAADELAARVEIVEAWSPASAVIQRGAPVPKRGIKGIARRVLRAAALSIMFPDREVLWI